MGIAGLAVIVSAVCVVSVRANTDNNITALALLNVEALTDPEGNVGGDYPSYIWNGTSCIYN